LPVEGKKERENLIRSSTRREEGCRKPGCLLSANLDREASNDCTSTIVRYRKGRKTHIGEKLIGRVIIGLDRSGGRDGRQATGQIRELLD